MAPMTRKLLVLSFLFLLCSSVASFSQASDSDGDNVPDGQDNCATVPNFDQANGDGDRLGDACDNCPETYNSPQEDLDGDGAFDVFEDLNHNGILDGCVTDPVTGRVTCQEDLDQDGRLTPPNGCEGFEREDVTCNGILDFESDLNQNGKVDPFEDTGIPCSNLIICPGGTIPGTRDDGKFDTEDRDGNGQLDTLPGSGYTPFPYWSDANGDGIPESGEFQSPLGTDHSDFDQDGLGDLCDNCPVIPNPGQEDQDGDRRGDACDDCPVGPASEICNGIDDNCDGTIDESFLDFDEDGVANCVDNCLLVPNPDQSNGDGDGLGDGCDNCPGTYNPPQEDFDGDGAFDVFEDVDHNGILDGCHFALNPGTGFEEWVCYGCFIAPDPDTGEPVAACGEDRDRDGRLTPPNGCEGNDREDFNCNGNLDFEADFNLNGLVDPFEDTGLPCSNPSLCPGGLVPGTRNNGLFDTEDRDGNRQLDTQPGSGDTPFPDWIDVNGNGVPELGEFRSPAGPDQTDSDEDGIGDVCDNCPEIQNSGQEDQDGDGLGDVCDLNQPPVADAGDDQVLECSASNGTLVTLDGTRSSDPDGDGLVFSWSGPFPEGGGMVSGPTPTVTLALGVHVVTLIVSDGSAESLEDDVVIRVIDTTAPQISFTLLPEFLWPPNHRLVEIEPSVEASDACGSPVISLTSILSNEPDDAPGSGDGNTANDIQGADLGTSDLGFQMLAERDGNGEGRVYQVVYSAMDGSGNTAQARAFVMVPHDVGGLIDPLNVAVHAEVGGTLLTWDTVPGAVSYGVIRGRVGNLREAGDFIDLGTVACVLAGSLETSTTGREDSEVPAAGEAFFYVAAYSDGRDSGYGSASASRQRVKSGGGCQ